MTEQIVANVVSRFKKALEEQGTITRPTPASEQEAGEQLAVAPPGWENTVQKMKEHKEIDNPWALCLAGGTGIPCLDGVVRTARDIADAQQDVWLYAFDPEQHLIVPGLARARYTGPRPAWEIILDNDLKLVCSPEHRWVRRDGSFVETKDLKAGNSLMPFKTTITKNSGHERVYQPGLGIYSPTHWAVMRVVNPSGCLTGQHLIHHKNENKRDNQPGNLEWMSKADHDRAHYAAKSLKMRAAYDKKFESDPLFRQHVEASGRKGAVKNWANPIYREKMTTILRSQASAAGRKAGEVHSHKAEERRTMGKNHTVTSVRSLDAIVPMYDVAVDGVHTFAVAVGVFSHNSWHMKNKGDTPHHASDPKVFLAAHAQMKREAAARKV